MAFDAINWASQYLPYRLEKMTNRDDYNLEMLFDTHDHGGSGRGGEIDNASSLFRGALRLFHLFASFGGSGISAGTCNSAWLTDDGTSSGSNLFDSTDLPKVIVYRRVSGSGSDIEDHVWALTGIGHSRTAVGPNFVSGNTADRDYYSEIKFQTGVMYCRICNAASAGYEIFLVIAMGKSA